MQHWISTKGLYSQLTSSLLSNCPACSSAVNAVYICSQVCAGSSDSGAIRVLLSEDSADILPLQLSTTESLDLSASV